MGYRGTADRNVEDNAKITEIQLEWLNSGYIENFGSIEEKSEPGFQEYGYEISLKQLNSGRGFLLQPKADVKESTTVRRCWLLYPGNGMSALDWESHGFHKVLKFLKASKRTRKFFFVEYPGYFGNSGAPSLESILKTSREAKSFLESEKCTEFGVFGHSLGTAAAVQAASSLEIQRVILSAPFTKMSEVVVNMVVSNLMNLVDLPSKEELVEAKIPLGVQSWTELRFEQEHYAYGAEGLFQKHKPFWLRIIESFVRGFLWLFLFPSCRWRTIDLIQSLPAQTEIQIYHGRKDFLIPVSMGEELHQEAERRGHRSRIRALGWEDHNSILGFIFDFHLSQWAGDLQLQL